MIVEARRYAQAVRGTLRNGHTPSDWHHVTGRSRHHIEKLASGGYQYVTAEQARRIEQALPQPLADWLHESPRHNCHVGEVPAHVVTPILDQAARRHGSERAAAHALGLNPRKLFQTRRQHAVTFRIADQIVTRTLGPNAWLNDPTLRKWYFAANVF